MAEFRHHDDFLDEFLIDGEGELVQHLLDGDIDTVHVGPGDGTVAALAEKNLEDDSG